MITPEAWNFGHTKRCNKINMLAIPRSFVASRAGSYPSALRSWLCRVTLRPGELIHWKSGDICAMVGFCWKLKQPVENSFDTSQVVGDHWISESTAFLKIQTEGYCLMSDEQSWAFWMDLFPINMVGAKDSNKMRGCSHQPVKQLRLVTARTTQFHDTSLKGFGENTLTERFRSLLPWFFS